MKYRFEQFELNPSARELYHDGSTVELEPRSFDLLLFLVLNRDRALAKGELQDEVWGTIVTDAAIARAVMKLRKSLGDPAADLIRTVPRFGYRFNGKVEELPDEAPPATGGDQSAGPRRTAIAVLPFANMSGDPENEYFSDGVAEEILNLLARIPALRVASRTSSFLYRNPESDVREIAEALDVDIVLEGSMRRAGNRARLAAQLIDARADAHLWSDIYDRELNDLFDVQVEIAGKIVASLTSQELGLISAFDAPSDPQAYDYYLRARKLFHRWDRGGVEHARGLFERAIEADPAYAQAWAGLAETLTMTYMWLDADPALLEQADEASRQALALAPHMAEAHTARGFTLSLLEDYSAATDAFRHAIELNPMHYEAWYLFGRSRFAEGRSREAAELFLKASKVRPDEYQCSALVSTALKAAGACREERAGHSARAVERVRARLRLNPEDTRALTLGANCLVDIGEGDEAVAWVERALSLNPDDIGVMHNSACCFVNAGQVDRAIDLFEKRFARAAVYLPWIEKDEDFKPLWEEPRFQALVEKIRRSAHAPG